MGKRKRSSVTTESILQNSVCSLPLESRRRIQRLNRQNRMHLIRNKRAAIIRANTPIHSNPDHMRRNRYQVQDRIVQSNPVPVQVNRTRNPGARARRALFQDPAHFDPSCISERLFVNDPDYDSDHSINGASLGFNDEQNDDSEITRKMFQPLNLGGPDRVCKKCGAIVWFEERNRKYSRLKDPGFSICCLDGKIVLPLLQRPPEYLQGLLGYRGCPLSSNFRSNIRKYNSMFAFTSMGGKIDKSINNGGGPYVFKLHGQNYHRIGSLLPDDGQSSGSQLSSISSRPRFAQLYIYDTEHEAHNRLGIYNDLALNIEIVRGLMTMLDQSNTLVKVFRTARDRYDASQVIDFRLRIICTRVKDARQYNLPSSNEVAGLLIGNDGEEVDHRDIVLEKRTGGLQRITELHPSYMAMQYPLIFPYGEDGYKTDILHNGLVAARARGRSTVSIREYYAFRIQHRENEGHTLLMAGRLFQQFLVDAYTSIEEERLRWVRKNQKKIRSELYQGLQDAVIQGDNVASNVGKRLVLPATFTGGPRYMVQNFQDAMAICRWFGSPDLFITVTCNPKWSEIIEALSLIPGQKHDDRPDIVSRMFKIKLDLLMDDLCIHKHFGKVTAAVYTIEFQKRGLPHAHILLFLDGADKPNTPVKINKIISAELPDKALDPLAYDSVLEFMIHGPCGGDRNSFACMEKGRCSKHFPKRFSDDTMGDAEGFYTYRRRDNGRNGIKNGVIVDNRNVVPHNVDLVVKYQCHINVEACNQGRAVKYLFKYIHKGKDRATVVIERNDAGGSDEGEESVRFIDEIKTYLDCRYISASEASWRIFGFSTSFREPAVERLPFHLENEQQVTYRDTDDPAEVLERASTSQTKFLQWMEINKKYPDDPNASDLTYAEFPTKWRWVEEELEWVPRKKGRVIGRIFYAHPTSGERYYLRILLNHVKGAKTYKDLRTFNNVTYNTFKEACMARGLLDDDGEWNMGLKIAGTWSNASSLRDMFVTMLMFCEVSDPLDLWNKNWVDLSDDILYKRRKLTGNQNLQMTDDEKKNAALCEIELLLSDNNLSLRNFPPMPIPDMTTHDHVNNRLVQEELAYDRSELEGEFLELHRCLNEEQKFVFDKVVHAVDSGEGGLYFVYGSGGTGKTFLWRTIISKLRSKGKIVLAVASSGIASLLLPGGRTAHSRFKIPLEVDDYSTCNISQKTDLAHLIRRADLVVWDEAPMNHRNIFEAVDKTFQDLMRDAEGSIFGGKTILLGGDFRQTLPIVVKGSREDVVAACISISYLWSQCQMFVLETNMRLQSTNLSPDMVKELAEFSTWVLKLGEGKLPTKSLNEYDDSTWIEIPDDLLIQNNGDPIHQIIESIYPDVSTRFAEPNYLKDRCILTPTNECVDSVNQEILSRITTTSRIYASADAVSPMSELSIEQDLSYSMEYLNNLEVSGVPNHLLELKIGVPVMLIRNINPSRGLCNGTRLVVTGLEPCLIRATIITGSKTGDEVTIHRIVASSAPTKWQFILRRRQFPLKVCFAMTINKSQGQTLQQVGIYLPRPVFSHGQLYVAVSRVTTRKGLKILINREEDEPVGCTKNVVYHEIFNGLPTGMLTCQVQQSQV